VARGLLVPVSVAIGLTPPGGHPVLSNPWRLIHWSLTCAARLSLAGSTTLNSRNQSVTTIFVRWIRGLLVYGSLLEGDSRGF
jgi:hypothetical protein